jgi:hypothetical protein
MAAAKMTKQQQAQAEEAKRQRTEAFLNTFQRAYQKALEADVQDGGAPQDRTGEVGDGA